MTPEFELKVMEKLGGLQTGMDDLKKQLLDNGQPGFITKTNNRLLALEKEDYRRTWIERAVISVIAFMVSGLTAVAMKFIRP